jgi:uncharacterized protein YndB with AHSA1/START domain/DNA-binding transcriptional ArsR family regulator
MEGSAIVVTRVPTVQCLLDALGSPVRREILWLVWDRELPAGAIAASCRVSAPTVSSHLGVLREAGLVEMRAEGSFRRYRARQDVVRRLQGLLLGESTRWVPADHLPERGHATATTGLVVTASADLTCPPQKAFTAFTDPEVYSRWLGVPVRIEDGRFACTLEWGTTVRGRYVHQVPPSLIVMVWDFEDDRLPLPGRELTAYWQCTPIEVRGRRERGCRVQVHQLVEDEEQAAFMHAAWQMVLGRLVEGMPAALRPGRAGAVGRRPRAKRQEPAATEQRTGRARRRAPGARPDGAPGATGS